MIRIDVIKDEVAGVYVGTSTDVRGLVVEADTLDALMSEANALIPSLLECQDVLRHDPVTDLRMGEHCAHA